MSVVWPLSKVTCPDGPWVARSTNTTPIAVIPSALSPGNGRYDVAGMMNAHVGPPARPNFRSSVARGPIAFEGRFEHLAAGETPLPGSTPSGKLITASHSFVAGRLSY